MPVAYIGDDHPVNLPVARRQVRVTVEESARYSITDPEANEEWLWTGPLGDHHIRLGEDQRAFAVPIFHELHCLRQMRQALANGNFTKLHPALQGHMHHCFIYLRQWTLCAADVTLEPGDFVQKNFTAHRTSGNTVLHYSAHLD